MMQRFPQYISTRVHMVALTDNPDLSLFVGARPNIFFDSEYYPSQITECTRKIRSGESGDVVLMVLDDEAQPLNMAIATTFELRDGPIRKIADAEVTAVR